MFSRSLAKAARYYGEGKAPCIVCNHIHTVYDYNNNNVCQECTLLSEEITSITKVLLFFYFKI